MAKNYPQISIPPPGPALARHHRARRARHVAELPQGLSAGDGARLRAGGRGRRRQPLPRLRGRHRRGGHRPLPPRGGGRDQGPGRPLPAHVRHRLLLRRRRQPGRAPGPPRPGPRPLARLLRQLGRRGGGSGDQARPPAYGPAEDRGLLRGLPRPHLRRDEPHREQAGPAPGLWPVPARGGALPLRVLLPLPGEPRARRRCHVECLDLLTETMFGIDRRPARRSRR